MFFYYPTPGDFETRDEIIFGMTRMLLLQEVVLDLIQIVQWYLHLPEFVRGYMLLHLNTSKGNGDLAASLVMCCLCHFSRLKICSHFLHFLSAENKQTLSLSNPLKCFPPPFLLKILNSSFQSQDGQRSSHTLIFMTSTGEFLWCGE